MLPDSKKSKFEISVNSQKTDDFSIINYQSKSSERKQQSEKTYKYEQESVTSEYQDNKSNSNQLLPVIQQSAEYESQVLTDSFPPSEIKALLMNKQSQSAVPMHLNIMVMGASGLGKSTFIDVILKKKFQMNSIIRDTTTQIHEIMGSIQAEQLTLNLKFIDTPGFKYQYSHKAWLRLITGYIKDQMKNYRNRKNQNFQTKFAFQESVKHEIDERVHVCFYFFSGPRVQQEDLASLKKLSGLVNVIPILAKGDSYTNEEILQIKDNFRKQIMEYQIELFQCVHNDQIAQSNFGVTPPYVIISSVDQFEHKGQLIYGRKFAWGICDIFNPIHSDLSILYKSLIGHFFFDLQKMTEFHYHKQLKNIKKREKKSQQKKYTMWPIEFIRSFFNY